jgi:hypothetical protein
MAGYKPALRQFMSEPQTTTTNGVTVDKISPGERRWLLGVVWTVCTLFLCGLTIADPDLWGHTLYGLRAIDAGILTERTDPFSYTANGAKWVNHEWLSETIYGGLWLTGEGFALVLWRNLLVGGLMILALFSLRRTNCGIAAGTLLLVLNSECLADFVVFIRPQLATFVLFGLFLFLLKKHYESPTRWIWSLPPLTALWVNLHGGFLAGLGMLGLYTCGAIVRALKSNRWQEIVGSYRPAEDREESRKRLPDRSHRRAARELSCVIFISILVTFVNPYGYVMHQMLWHHLITKQLVREWQPIWVTGHGIVSWVPFMLIGFTLCFSRRADKSASSDGRQSLTGLELVVLAVVGWQAMSHLRHVALLCITTLILLPGPLNQAIGRAFGILSERWSQRRFRFRRAIGIASVCFFLFLLQVRGSIELWKHGITPWEIAVECKSYVPGMPANSVAFIKQHDLKGNLITDYGWGQFVIWHLFPANQVAFDGRYRTVYSARLEQEFVDFQLTGIDMPKSTPMLDDHATEIAVLPAGKSPDRYLGQRTDWACVFRDDQSVIYLRRLSQFTELIEAAESGDLSAKPGPAWTHFPGLDSTGTPVASQTSRSIPRGE